MQSNLAQRRSRMPRRACLMDDLYRDYILDHYKRPRNFGELDPHDMEALEHNPLCGDELGVHIRVKDGRIEDLRLHGHGCAISQASASIASEELVGMPLAEVGELDADWARVKVVQAPAMKSPTAIKTLTDRAQPGISCCRCASAARPRA